MFTSVGNTVAAADLSVLRSVASPVPNREPAAFSEAISIILFNLVLGIVDLLGEWGFVSTADGRTSIPSALRPALVQAIYAEGAPFSIRLEPGAIPLEE